MHWLIAAWLQEHMQLILCNPFLNYRYLISNALVLRQIIVKIKISANSYYMWNFAQIVCFQVDKMAMELSKIQLKCFKILDFVKAWFCLIHVFGYLKNITLYHPLVRSSFVW